MDSVESFLNEHPEISASTNRDSFYFTIDGQKYRVSNHSVEASNSAAYDKFGNQKRASYHPNGRENDTIYIHASKTRIENIFNDLKAGKKLDGRGNIIKESIGENKMNIEKRKKQR